jgi:hypothetical protein
MMLGPALIARLAGDSAVTALAGNRIYWLVRPQGQVDDLPAIVLQLVSETRGQHLKGWQDMFEARLQVACMATRYSVSRQLCEAAMAALVGVAEVTDPAGPDVLFWRADLDGPRDLGGQDDTRFVHRAVVDILLRYGTAA